MAELENLFTVRQVQDLLQVDRITIYRMLSSGRLVGVKIGGQWRFREQDIRHLLAARPEAPAPQPATASETLLPFPCVEAMGELFAEAAAVAMVVTDLDGLALIPCKNACAFCELIQSTEAGARLCQAARATLAHSHERLPRLQPCHAGLLCAQVQITLDGKPVAVALAGQVLPAEQLAGGHDEQLGRLAEATGIPLARLQAAFPSVHRLDQEQMEKMLRLLKTLGVAICRIGSERQRLVTKLERIAEITAQR